MFFVGFLYPFIYLFSNTKCFQLSFSVSTWTLCAPVGRGGRVYPGARASRGTEVSVCPSEALMLIGLAALPLCKQLEDLQQFGVDSQ